VLGPLYHTGPFGTTVSGVMSTGRVVVMETFDAARALDLIERHRVNAVWAVPAQMQRMARVEGVERHDLSSIESLYHSGAVCPPWLKRAWIDLVGADHVYEGFGSTEAVGMLVIRGDEWLQHPGSVGRPDNTDVRICDEAGADVPTGSVGEIFMRWRSGAPLGLPDSYTYWGSPRAKATPDGFVSVGDLGRFDGDGYLYIADRRVDMIVTGGVNVYPAEIEVVLSEHPAVKDVAVVGVPDTDWGRRVHAILEVGEDVARQELVQELDQHCRARLARPKVPKTYEFSELPRNDAGKIRRSVLVEERAGNPRKSIL
jgi:bile acid-coenzyme A ligase